MKIIHLCQLLLLVAIASLKKVTASVLTDDDCHKTLVNVEKGKINATFRDSWKCGEYSWIVSAFPGKRLLVSVDIVKLPSPRDKLYITIDNVTHPVPFECQQCFENVVGGILNVTLVMSKESLRSRKDGLNVDTLTKVFSIQFASFDPRRCPSLPPVSNGTLVGKGRKIGDKVYYRCSEPYLLVGSHENACHRANDSLVPSWMHPSPTCTIPSCEGGNVSLNLDRGAIVHPGYPNPLTSPLSSCMWEITAAQSNRIKLHFKYFNLPTKKGDSFLFFYDGNTTSDGLIAQLNGKNPPSNLSTTSSKLFVQFKTENLSEMDGTNQYGFYIHYSTFVLQCESVGEFIGGTIDGNSTDVGANLHFVCANDSVLVGVKRITCLDSGVWSSSKPTCLSKVEDTHFLDESTDLDPQAGSSTHINESNGSEVVHGNSMIYKQQLPNHKDDWKTVDKDDKRPIDGSQLEDVEEQGVDTLSDSMATGETPVREAFPIIPIVLGISIPLVILVIVVFTFIMYRKRYPVRMGLGRKFETFENPIYEQRKRGFHTQGIQDPAELQKLTYTTPPPGSH